MYSYCCPHLGHFCWASQQKGLTIYLAFGLRNWCQEDKEGKKEADAQVQMDGGSWALDRADHWECQNADKQANEWKGKAPKCHHLQLKVVLLKEKGYVWKLNTNRDTVQYVYVIHCLDFLPPFDRVP